MTVRIVMMMGGSEEGWRVRHLLEQVEGEGLCRNIVGVVPEKAAGHEPHRVQLPVLLLNALAPPSSPSSASLLPCPPKQFGCLDVIFPFLPHSQILPGPSLHPPKTPNPKHAHTHMHARPHARTASRTCYFKYSVAA